MATEEESRPLNGPAPGESLAANPGAASNRAAVYNGWPHNTTLTPRAQAPNFPGDLSAALVGILADEEAHRQLANYYGDTAAWHVARWAELRDRRRQLEAYLPRGRQ